MGRSILGAVVGYLVVVIVVTIGVALAWGVLGGAGAFAGEGPYPSAAWLAINLAFGLLGAVAAGWVALKVGRSDLAVKILVGLVAVLGVLFAVTAESAYRKRVEQAAIDKPVAELTFMEAGQVAKNPAWYNWAMPVIGVVGVLVGGRRRG